MQRQRLHIAQVSDAYSVANSASTFRGFAHMAAGLTCGFCGLGAGYAIGRT